VRLGDSEVVLANRSAADGDVTISIRPEAICVETAPGPAGALPGTIIKASYIGAQMEYSIETEAGTLFATCPHVDRPLKVNEKVALVLAPRGVLVVDRQVS